MEKLNQNNKSHFFIWFWGIIFVIALFFGGGYVLYTSPMGQSALLNIQQSLGFEHQTTIIQEQEIKQALNEIEHLKQALATKEQVIQTLSNQAKTTQNATQEKLRYFIKPKQQTIAECYSMQVGSWQMPQGCLLSLSMQIPKELDNDPKVVAFEIQGIVDTTPYKGLSPELKQEGLASFRAKEAMQAIQTKIPHAITFEGPSLQMPNKRGYLIKVYFVQ